MKRLLPILIVFGVFLGSAGNSFALPECPGSPAYGKKRVKNWNYCFGEVRGTGKSRGHIYVGEFKNGKRHGSGTYTWPSGAKYIGEFEYGKKHGQGKWITKTGNQLIGRFEYNKRPKYGTYIFSKSGRKYVGELKKGKGHGQGTLFHPDGTVFKEGIWENGKFKYANKVDPTVTAEKSQPIFRTNTDEPVSASPGSAFAVFYSGHIITNNHVIDGCQKIKIHHKGETVATSVITYDRNNDRALLKGDFSPSTVFSLSNSKPELLQDVYVAGYPFGRAVGTSVKVTKGIISSLTGIGNNFSNMQIDAALQPGNRGGPILDDKGNVVGVAVAKLDLPKSLKDAGVIPENTNFGIKTNVLRSILESNDVSLPTPNTKPISKTKLGKMISDGSYYLSCWMTMAQIEKMKSRKVIFQNLD